MRIPAVVCFWSFFAFCFSLLGIPLKLFGVDYQSVVACHLGMEMSSRPIKHSVTYYAHDHSIGFDIHSFDFNVSEPCSINLCAC
jgi:hypothetical protein